MLSSIAGYIYLVIAVPAVAWDLTEWRIPDLLTLGGAAVLAAVRIGSEGASAVMLLESACIAAGLCYALWGLTGGGIGRGDAKYALQLGILVPGGLVAFAMLAACVAALAAAVLSRAAFALPFSPFMVIGALLFTTLSELGLA